jgi:hypothetical protein
LIDVAIKALVSTVSLSPTPTVSSNGAPIDDAIKCDDFVTTSHVELTGQNFPHLPPRSTSEDQTNQIAAGFNASLWRRCAMVSLEHE